MARPTIVTEDVVAKLEEAFKIGATPTEACNYANISRDAYYDRLKKDQTFSDRMDSAKEWPILAMKKVVVQKAVGGDEKSAMWYLERKKKDEFAPRQELSGPEGLPLGYIHSGDFKQLAPQEDAIQIDKATEVPLLPEAGPSQEMGQEVRNQN